MTEKTIGSFTRNMPWKGLQDTGMEPLLTREWLVTNGLGGYAWALYPAQLHGVTTASS